MARVKRNPLLEGMSGAIGKNLVFRQMRDGSTIVSAKPDISNRKFSEGQLTHQKRFQEASAYARDAAKSNPIYAQLAAGTTKTAYNITFSDWFNPPEINSIRQQDDGIQVEASDNVTIAKVLISVLDEFGKILDQGNAVLHGDHIWEYATSAKGVIRAEVWDLAGNMGLKINPLQSYLHPALH